MNVYSWFMLAVASGRL